MSDLQDPNDPFSAQNAPGLSLIVQMRTYDVLLALLNHFDEETADKITEAHESGQILTSLPSFVSEGE